MIFMGFYMNNLIKKRITNSTKKGFTLVELVIVIAVIAILVGVSVAAYFGIQKEAKEKALLAEATDAYNEYRINQILNNDDSLNESSLIEGVYYSKNFDEYILFKDDTTYNLGSYIKESNEFSNTNRFAIDYDNDGLPVIIDLDNSVEGIEDMHIYPSYSVNTFGYGFLNTRTSTNLNNIKAYSIFANDNIEYGDPNIYNSYFFFKYNDEDYSNTPFDDRETLILYNKFDFIIDDEYSNPTLENIVYSNTFIEFLEDKGISINKNPYYLIAHEGDLILPSNFDNIPVTTIGRIYSMDEDIGYLMNGLMRIQSLTIPSNYSTCLDNKSLMPMDELSNFYDNNYAWVGTSGFYCNLKNIYVESDSFLFEGVKGEPCYFISNPDNDLTYHFESLESFSYNSLFDSIYNGGIMQNVNEIINEDGDKSTISCLLFGFYAAELNANFNIKISVGSLEEKINDNDVSNINIYANYLTDVEILDNKTSINITNIPTSKSLIIPLNSSNETKIKNNSVSINIADALGKNNTLSVSLNNNLEVSGNLILGGTINQTGMGYQGLISGDYATLDLNGHTLTIKDGGYLESYGNIIDSVGGGKIVVEKGGKILTPFVVTDFNGGTVTVGRYNSNMSPFNSYMMPYLNADVEILNGGTLLGNCVLYAGGSHNETQIKFIGNTSDSLIQTLNDSSKVSLSKSGSLKDLSSYYEVIDLEGEFNINAMNLEFITYNIKTNKVPFPVSQYLSINIKNNSIIHLNQLLKVMYGSKINVDQNSTLIFEDIESSNSLQSGIFVYPSFNKNSIKYSNSNDVSKANGNILGLSYYKEEHSSSYIDIKGNIIFKGNNHIFAGKFDNITNFERDIVNNLDNIEISSYSLYEGGDYQNSSKDWLKGEYNYQNGSSAANYYSLPLIIYDKAYIKGSDNNLIEGSFDLNKGTFKENNLSNTYIFIFDNNDFKFGYELFNDNVEMYFTYNSKGSFIKVDEVLNNDIYKINNKEYVYYLGTFVEGSIANENNTFTFINNKFKYNPLKEDLTEEITLTYSSTDKRWNQ